MTAFGKWMGLALCVWLSACGTGSALVTMSSFDEVPVGASSSEVVELLGEPYAIRKHSDGTVEYEYIERITAGVRNFEERHYFLIFKEDRLVSRRVKSSSPPGYRFDSYEMQTTDNQTAF
jgi:SmpA / OmlA family.